MSAFPDWKKYAVSQRRPLSGCIPTGYEILLRAANIQGIDYETFQDEFDLDKDLKPGEQTRNNFESVSRAVQSKYPQIKFIRVVFSRGRGSDKLKFIEKRITAQQPVLISLSQAPFGGKGWHIMPVVDAIDNYLVLLEYMDIDGKQRILRLPKSELIRIHDEYEGGDDVAFLTTIQP